MEQIKINEEEKKYLSDTLSFILERPFSNYDKQELKDLRDLCLDKIKEYKELKKRIEEKRKHDEMVSSLIKKIQSL